MKQQSQINSERSLGRETKEEKKSERDKFWFLWRRQKEKEKIYAYTGELTLDWEEV
jgi:hypothetical protein